MNHTLIIEDRSRGVVTRFLADTVDKLGWAAARVAWVDREGMQLEPWQLSTDAPSCLAFLRSARAPRISVSIARDQRFSTPTVIAPEQLACSSEIAQGLRTAEVDSVVVLDIDGVLDFEARFVFVPAPGRPITPEACASLHAAVQLIPVVLRQEFERGELSRGSMLDPLTGLLNRTGLEVMASGYAHSDSRAIVFVDLDRFKAINDAHGHAVGDEVLSGTGERLASRIRPTDLVGRLGGDEFVMVANNVADDESAIVVAQRLVSAVARDHLLDSGEVVSVEASAGVVVWEAGRPFADVVNDADELMYEAKRIGGGIAARDARGRVLVADVVAGGHREIVESERSPVEVTMVQEVAGGDQWGAHLLWRGELCSLGAQQIAEIVRDHLVASGSDYADTRNLLIEPRGRGWATDDRLVEALRALPDGPRLTVMIDGQPSSADLRMVTIEARARGLVDVALTGVGAAASDVRLLGALKPDFVVLDRELTMNLATSPRQGVSLEIVAAMARVVNARVVVLDPPSSVHSDQLAQWQCDLTTGRSSQ